jgi:hypothetical protein
MMAGPVGLVGLVWPVGSLGERTVRTMGRSGVRLLAAGLALAMGSVAACADESDDDPVGAAAAQGDRGEAADLAARLPAGATSVGAVDLDAARSQLGLADDTDVDNFDFTAEPERARLLGVAVVGLPYLGSPRNDVPLKWALDTGQVHAAAAVADIDRERGAAIVATDQSFDDLAEALIEAGYERRGDLVVGNGPLMELVFPVVADGGDGTIVLARSEAAARNVLEGEAGSTPALDLLAQSPGIAATAGASPDGLACGNGVGVGVDLEPATGEIVIFAGDGADPARAIADPASNPILRELELGERRAQDGYIRVEFEYSTDVPLRNPTRLVSSDLPAGEIYEC